MFSNPINVFYLGLIALIVGMLSGGALVWNYEHPRIELVQSEYDGFVAQTRLIGQQAQKQAAAKDEADKQAKERDDHANEITVAALLVDNQRLRDTRARSRFVPTASAGAKHPERACFVRTKLESAIQLLDSEVQGIITGCDVTRVNLDTAKVWNRER